MTLLEFKQHLHTVTEVTFLKPDGKAIPKHFHITEVGQSSKRFIDCGGTARNENVIIMQLWESIDFWHRLEPTKLNAIIELSEKKLDIGNHEIEIEYQNDTIGKYNVGFDNGQFTLLQTKTNCLALDKCGIPTLEAVKDKVVNCCAPNSGCC